MQLIPARRADSTSYGVSPTSTARLRADRLESDLDQVGLGLGAVDVGGGLEHDDVVADVEVVEGLVGELRVTRGRQRDPVAGVGELADEVGSTRQRGDLGLDLDVLLAPVVAQGVAEPLLDVVTGHLGDQLVAAHPDGAVDPPQRDRQVVRSKARCQAMAWW